MGKIEHYLWTEKYRPTHLEQYIFHDESQKKAFTRMIAEKQIPNLLLSGVAGTGKTTIAKIIINELGLDVTDVLVINASDENSVDTIRDKIKAFVGSFAMGEFKVVHLEEADYITVQGQGILRRMMEEFSDTARFILTCNYENKIIPAIKSRCQHFRFKASNREDVTEYVANILIVEKVKFSIDQLDKYVSIGYPDIRKIVNLLQQNTTDKKLHGPSDQAESGDYKFALIDLVERDRWSEARKVICDNVVGEQYEEVYRFLYDNLHRAPKFTDKDKWEAGIVTIAEHLYKDSAVSDREINVAALLIRLSQI
jgi:DNA polymerase III delta prime subunit